MKEMVKQLKYDFRMGTIKRWKFHMMVVISFLLFCSILAANHKGIAQSAGRTITGIDLLAYLMQGQKILPLEKNDMFNMPFYWFVLQIGYLVSIIFFPRKDFEIHGYQHLIRMKSRGIWWSSKCVWCIFELLFYYGIVVTSAWLVSGVIGEGFYTTKYLLIGENLSMLSETQQLFIILVIPIVTSIPIALFGTVISMKYNEMMAMMLCMTVVVAEVYWYLPFLPGEYAILCRWCDSSQYLMRVAVGIGISLAWSLFFIWYGKKIVKKMELFS